MIPLKIELKNFLCYGDKAQIIDFKNHELICLSGKNGHGKSALLDAITWAVWGQARKTSGAPKADEGLLRLGQTRMMVSFEFMLSDKIYRVRREFAKTYGKPYAALDVESFNAQENKFICLSDKTIKKTQEQIEQLIGLDYDTFINTSFLKQGQSNEFSKKTPKERKQILANILNLSRFDKLQQRALEETRKSSEEKRMLCQLQEQDQKELEKEPETLSLLDQEKLHLLTLTQAIETEQQKLLKSEQDLKKLEETERQHIFLNKELHTLTQKIAQENQNLVQLKNAWQATHAQALKLPDNNILEKKRQELVLQEKQYLELQQKTITLQEAILKQQDMHQKRLHTIQTSHEQQRNFITLELNKSEFTQKQLEQILTQKKQDLLIQEQELKRTNQEFALLLQKLTQKQIFEKEFEALKKQFEKRRTFYQTLVQNGNICKTRLKELDIKKNIACDNSNPACPLCQQVLTATRKNFLHKQFDQEERFLQNKLNRVTNLITKLKEILVTQHKEVESKQNNYDAFSLAIIKKEALEKTKITIAQNIELLAKLNTQTELDLQKTHTQITKIKQELTTHTKTLEQEKQKDPDITAIAAIIKTLTKEKEDLDTDRQKYKTLQTNMRALDEEFAQLNTIKKELTKQHERKAEISQRCKQLKQAHIARTQYNQAQKQLAFKPEDLTRINMHVQKIKTEINKTLEEKERILPTIGRLENTLQRFGVLKNNQKTRTIKLFSLEDAIEEYQILAQTFSKNGIQALLIEEVIPEIEEEANSIISKLTNNQSQIFIESLKDLKSGGVKETLDINIADSIGIRPYELYSGGEAFRIDFALRIAISKLLARRAGTALQTLIIDEGFGSQDEEGLGLLMNAIHAIKSNFAKIIIVSHLNEFKDNFPAHFIVEKDSTGSRVRIEERG
ncbi:MAG: SMC family ATPase [bacterium]